MIPVIAIVGRPNVGKSTLFNCLTRSKDALVADFPGVTRDRIYGQGKLGKQDYIVIDTGGITGNEIGIDQRMAEQSLQAVAEADIILFVVDAKEGLTALDEQLARTYRSTSKPVFVAVNKTDGAAPEVVCADFYQLGLTHFPIAAAHNRGMQQLIENILTGYDTQPADETSKGIKIAVVGRPNVGKSTIVNRLIGEDRVVVYDQPGTTRDSVFIDIERFGQSYTLIDTAGVRRKGRVKEAIEKFSVVKTLRAIEMSDVAICLFDATENITDQDLHMLSYVLDAGKSLVIAVNKWDGLSTTKRDRIKSELSRRLQFLNFVDIRFISAKHGSGVGNLFNAVNKAYKSAIRTLSTPLLTRLLLEAVESHPPPLIKGRRIKLRYAHAGGKLPPVIVIHGNQTQHVSESYVRYLKNHFRKALKIHGTPIRIEFKGGDNPYKDKKNTLSHRQLQKRKRLKKFVQKKDKSK